MSKGQALRRLKPWHQMLKIGNLQRHPLQVVYPNISLSRFKYPNLNATEVTNNTLFLYPNDEIAGLYLRQVIPIEAQQQALAGLRLMNFPLPHRKETATAVARQKGNTAPGELLFGYIDRGSIEQTKVTLSQGVAFSHLGYILTYMTHVFARTLPKIFGLHNRPLPDAARWQAYHNQHKALPNYGGIAEEMRIFLTSFSSVTVLKSCPSSIHKDAGNARRDQTNFSCLTTVRDTDFKGGGEFCLAEFGLKIPVRPGDMLLLQGSKEWHYNMTPVRGTKYSLVCYFRTGTSNPKRLAGRKANLLKRAQKAKKP